MARLTQTFVTKGASSPDPHPTFRFWVEIQSIIVADFQECNGLRLERTVEMIEEGGVNDHVQILPGRNKYSNITLKKGVTSSDALWNWYQTGLYDAKVKRVNFSILLLSSTGTTVKRWNVVSGFPVKWEGPQFATDSNQISIETLEIAHHGLTLGS